MSDAVATVQVSPEVMETIIKTHVQGALLAALGEGAKEQILEAMVKSIMETTRGEIDGGRCSYEQRREPYFSWLLKKKVLQIAENEVDAFVQDLRPEIAKAMRSALGRTKDDLVRQIAEKFATKITGNFNAHVSFRGDDD